MKLRWTFDWMLDINLTVKSQSWSPLSSSVVKCHRLIWWLILSKGLFVKFLSGRLSSSHRNCRANKGNFTIVIFLSPLFFVVSFILRIECFCWSFVNVLRWASHNYSGPVLLPLPLAQLLFMLPSLVLLSLALCIETKGKSETSFLLLIFFFGWESWIRS